MILSEVVVKIVRPEEEGRFRELMQSHHYLGAMPKIGETLWYVAHVDGTWLALAVFSAPALKCRARDSWVGWDFRYQYGRLHLVSNNSRLLILPGHHYRNLGSRFLGLCARRIVGDWPARFGHPLLLLETFVDPARFQGTVYRAANWQAVGHSRGFRRGGAGYCELSTPKRVFLYPLARNVGQQLNPAQRSADLSADHIRSLPDVFRDIDDPHPQGAAPFDRPRDRRDAPAATRRFGNGSMILARKRLEVRRRNGVRTAVPIHHPHHPGDPATRPPLQRWHQQHGGDDVALAIDGKTLRNAIDEHGTQVHVMSVVRSAWGLRHRHSASTRSRTSRQDPHRRCVADPAQACGLPPRTQRRLPLDRRTISGGAILPCSSPPRRKPNQTSRNHPPSRTDASGAIWTTTVNEHSTSLASAKSS